MQAKTPKSVVVLIGFVVAALSPVFAADLALQCDPARTTADFTLGDTLHTVHGSFLAKRGELHFDPATGKVSGEIVFDATSGHTDSKMRDKKMHKEILESATYPDIVFRPDHVVGPVTVPGSSSVQVHGTFAIHGSEHEIDAKVEVKLERDHWQATAHFPVPYVKWGMKNPSVLFLRVGDSVDIDLHAEGKLASLASPGQAGTR